jgi:hypothetical protein
LPGGEKTGGQRPFLREGRGHLYSLGI